MDGFEVIRRRTPERMPVLVFLTAYDQFAIKAFEAQALDYLVKPVTEARFSASMRRVTKALRATGSDGRDGSLVVATPGGAVVLRHSEIDWIESADNYSRVWVGRRSYMLRESLRTLEDRVRRPASVVPIAGRWYASPVFASWRRLERANWWRCSAPERGCRSRAEGAPRSCRI